MGLTGVIALLGNPNVGKSTVFNELTGLHQHTGNWPGKTVTSAGGNLTYQGDTYFIVDLPGTYSLLAHSKEEECARDFICFQEPDCVIAVCDATCLERNLNLVLQAMEMSDRVIVCVNLMDEAEKKNIHIDCVALSELLGVPVVGTAARSHRGLDQLLDEISCISKGRGTGTARFVTYEDTVEEAVSLLQPILDFKLQGKGINKRWLALKLLCGEDSLEKPLLSYLGPAFLEGTVAQKTEEAQHFLAEKGISKEALQDKIVGTLVGEAEKIARSAVRHGENDYSEQDRRADRILTDKWMGYPIMLLLLVVVFWLTIVGANYPSKLLATGLFWIEDVLVAGFIYLGAPPILYEMLVYGVYRVLAWVVSVMLPPMAIFFPLFTLLEDVGYLPRVAFNLDRYFKQCGACGKQALTTCMGFGCNAAGVIGCRIIDSKRERLIAILTNNFVPCNGRFPTMIALITMFFVGTGSGILPSVLSALALTGIILLGIGMTFFTSAVLSKTILKGEPSSFTLELPPYRRPQILNVLVRSLLDRTLFVLGRAVVVAAPAGLLIWLLANITLGEATLLSHLAGGLDPFAGLLGLDGVILLAFILGLPANEIVLPIIIMTYMSTGSLLELDSLPALRELLVAHGWTWVTAVSTLLFSLMHWPCSTTCLTIKKETGSIKWTAAALLIPTIEGIACCFLFASVARMCGWL